MVYECRSKSVGVLFGSVGGGVGELWEEEGGGGQCESYYQKIDALKLYYYVFIYDLGRFRKHNEVI